MTRPALEQITAGIPPNASVPAASDCPPARPDNAPLRWVMFGLLASGMVLSVLAATYRLPINSDETGVVDRALRLFDQGPNPKWFLYPSLHLYMVAVAEGILFSVRWLLDLSPTPQSFAEWYFDTPRPVYIVARFWSVAAGIATLVVVYRLGVALATPSAGLVAAAFLALSPMHIYYSAIAKPDAAMVLAMQIAGLLGVQYVQRQGAGLPWGAAAVAGLGATLKYPGGAAWFAAPAALLLKPAVERPGAFTVCRQITVLGAIAVVVFAAGTPFALVEFEAVYHDLSIHWKNAIQTMPGGEGLTSWRLYLGSVLPGSLSLPILGLAIVGLVVLLRHEWRSAAVALAPAAAYAIPVFLATPMQLGFVLPLLPMLCLCAGIGFERCRAAFPGGPRQQAMLQGLLILLCVVSPAEAAICNQIKAQRLTAQEQTALWIREHLPPGSRIFGTATGITLPLTADRLTELLAAATKNRPAGGAFIRYLQRTTPTGTGYYFYDMDAYARTPQGVTLPVAEYDPEWIVTNKLQYIVDSEVKMGRFFKAPDRYPLPFRFQQWLAEHGELVFTTHPGSRGFPDWRDNPARVRALEPRCGIAGGEFRVYRIQGGALHQ